MLKHLLRLIIGRSLKTAGLTEKVRSAYFSRGRNFIRALGDVQGSWFRRSVVTQDFVPVISDIDLTILLNRSQIEHLFMTRQLGKRPLLLQDIQLVYEPFLNEWLKTGGLRNRQIPSWIPCEKCIALTTPTEKSREVIAFEVSNELYLIYKQLVTKLSLPYQDETAQKLYFELNRLIRYWAAGDDQLLREPRSNFSFNLNESKSVFFNDLNLMCKDLLNQVNPRLSELHPEKIMLEEGPGWTRLNLKMENRFITLVSAESIPQMAKKFPDDFVTTREFVALTLGVGIQDQPLLNQLAWKERGYYRDFCTQRLAHDLIGSLLLNPENGRQLYFCFKNIDEFLKGFTGLRCIGWEEISALEESDAFSHLQKDVLVKTFRNLELLESVR